MKIAQLAPLSERVPPLKYGGTERVIHTLTEELVKRGHEVTLFASGDSQTSARKVSVIDKSLRESRYKDPYGLNPPSVLNIGLAYSMQGQFDIIHDHNHVISLPAANLAKTPVVLTLHGPVKEEFRRIYESLNHPFLVTISKAQLQNPGTIRHMGTVYNGLDMSAYPEPLGDGGYLLFVGRISFEKGVHTAIRVAKHLDLPLIIAAKLDEQDKGYFKERVEPHLSEKIVWIGEVDEEERNQLYSQAKCLLHPVTWPEPFGLTMIEAMACGCPVIAYEKGSVPEVVNNGKSGFVVSSFEQMVSAVQNLEKIDRLRTRKYSLSNFNAKKMADGYEEIYQLILEKSYSSSRFPQKSSFGLRR